MLIFSGTNVVAVETDIMDIMGVNDKQFSVTISMYFAVKWDEPRIETNNTVTEGIYIILEREKSRVGTLGQQSEIRPKTERPKLIWRIFSLLDLGI